MTDFKPGDRVNIMIGTGKYHQDRCDDIVRSVEPSSHGLTLGLASGRWGYAENAFLINPRPLVGPAPTPPAAPRYVAPFESNGAYIKDANGTLVLFVSADVKTADVVEFSKYVATALNASVFNED